EDIDVFALSRITGDSLVANIGQPTKLGLNLIHSMYSLRGDLESPIILPLVGIPLVPASLLNTTSTDSIQSDLDLVIQKLTSSGGEGIRDTLDQYQGALPSAGAAAVSLTDATPQDVVTSAVEGNIEGLGTNVVVDGATLNAGRDVAIH